jgi:adenylylsulfate kinase
VPCAAIGEMMFEGKARPITMCPKGAQEPIAAGLTVACKRENAAEPCNPPADLHGLTVWLTGLSGAGKTTIAVALGSMLQASCRVELLDADQVRTHLCKGLGFTEEDRRENVWRLALVAGELANTGAIVLVSAISPYRSARDEARGMIGRFIEVYVNAPLSICESRDPKGLYKRARNGEIQRFTGIDDPYESPLNPEIECRTDVESIDESVAKVMAAIESMGTTGRNFTEPASGDVTIHGNSDGRFHYPRDQRAKAAAPLPENG